MLIATLYGRTLNFGLSYFDDDAIILANAGKLEQGVSPGEALLSDAEFGHSVELYRPLQNLAFVTDHFFFGDNYGLYRLSNLMLHFLSCLTLLFLLLQLGGQRIVSGAVALAFAVHPMFSLDVVWLPARGDLLLAFFGLLSLLFFVKYYCYRKVLWLALHLISFFMALLAKESAMALPLVCATFYVSMHKGKNEWKAGAVWLFVLLILSAAYLLMRNAAIPRVPGGSFGLAPLWANLRVIPEFFWKFFIPWNIPSMPFYETGRTLGGLMVMAGFAALIVYFRSRWRSIFPGLLWFLLLSIPAMLYRPEWSDYAYDYCLHRAYFPAMGLGAAAVFIPAPPKAARIITVVAGIWLISAFTLNWMSIPDYSNTLSFYTRAAETNPRSALVANNLGNALFMNGRYAEASSQYREALRLYPGFTDARYNLSMTQARNGELDSACANITLAVGAQSNNPKYLKGQARILTDLRKTAEAVKVFERLYALGQKDPETLYNYSACLLSEKDYGRSASILEELLAKNPSDQRARLLRVQALHFGGQAAEALTELKLVSGFENKPDLQCNAGYLYLETGSLPAAAGSFRRSLAMNAKNPDAHLGLAILAFWENKPDQAILHIDSAALYEPRLKQGPEGLKQMMAGGYYFTSGQISALEVLLR